MVFNFSLAMFGFLTSFGFGLWLVKSRWARTHLADVANERSSHTGRRVRGGGIGFLLVAVAVGVFSLLTAKDESLTNNLVLFSIVLVGGVGLIDDLKSLSAKTRLIAQLFSSLAILLAAYCLFDFDPSISVIAVLVPILVFYAVSLINFFNFADGINGYVGLSSLFMFAGFIGLVGTKDQFTANLLFGLVGSLIGFLFWNVIRGQVFMGDAGSTLLGLLAAWLSFVHFPFNISFESSESEAVRAAVTGLLLVLSFSIWVYLDCLVMAVAKLVAGVQLSKAHREHFYQRLSREYFQSHMKATGALTLSQALFGVLCTYLLLRGFYFGGVILFGLTVSLIAFFLYRLHSKSARSMRTP